MGQHVCILRPLSGSIKTGSSWWNSNSVHRVHYLCTTYAMWYNRVGVDTAVYGAGTELGGEFNSIQDKVGYLYTLHTRCELHKGSLH